MREIVIIRVYFFTPSPPLLFYSLRTCRDRTVWPIFVFYGLKDVFPRQLRPFLGAKKNFLIISTIFRKKNAKFPIPAM